MDSSKVKCSSCKVLRQPDAFIGNTGSVVKTCLNCREKNAKTKQRPDARAKHAELLRANRYDTAHRAKKRDENEAGYLAHNAQSMALWRAQQNTQATLSNNDK